MRLFVYVCGTVATRQKKKCGSWYIHCRKRTITICSYWRHSLANPMYKMRQIGILRQNLTRLLHYLFWLNARKKTSGKHVEYTHSNWQTVIMFFEW